MRQRIAHEVNPASLPGSGKDLGNGGFDAFVGIGHGEFDATQTAPCELTQELRPDRLSLRGADFHAEHFASTIRVDADRDDHRDGDDASATPDLEVGGIDPKIWPVTFDGA